MEWIIFLNYFQQYWGKVSRTWKILNFLDCLSFEIGNVNKKTKIEKYFIIFFKIIYGELGLSDSGFKRAWI